MATRTRNLNVVVGAEVRPFERGINRADKAFDKFSKQTTVRGRVTSAGIKGVGVAATGATAAIGGLAAGGAYLIKQYEESAKVGRQTNAVIKSTGGAAGVTAKHVDQLATSISRKTGMDDEAIASAQNVLLTFTKVRNETGKGNQVFDQATRVIADMSAALGQGLQSSTIQVGKALNDPIKGVTALQKVGVSFTADQRRQIETLVQSGRTLDAQKVILRELRTEFAGSAEAAATPFNKLQVSVGNLAETAGGALAPKVEQAANKLNTFITEIQDGTGAGGRFADQVEEIADDVRPIISDFASAASSVAKFTAKHPDIVKVAGAVVGVGVALKTLKFASSVTGFSDLLKAGRGAATGLKRVLGSAGTQAGTSLAANAAEQAATHLPTSMDARRGRFRTALTSVFKRGGSSAGTAASAAGAEAMANRIDTSMQARKGKFATAGRGIGTAIGAAAAPVAILLLGTALADFLGDFNDRLEKKGGIAGIAGWLSNAGEWIAKKLPQTKEFFGKATGGRIPGARVAADSVPALLSPQEFVVTGDGERTLEGMTFPGVLNWLQGVQAPHFANGGRAPKRMAAGGFVATSYGPPWGGMQGTGVTRTGVNLKSAPHIYGIAVDPSVIPLGSDRYVHPNPFGYRGRFEAFDTGGAIKGRRIDFYDWRGRAAQNRWGRREVTVSRNPISGERSTVVAGAGSGHIASQYLTGYQAGLEGSSIRGVLGTALEYVGEPHRRESGSIDVSSAGGGLSGAPTAVSRMLGRAKSIASKKLPYTYGGGHGRLGAGTPGFDCSGYVSAILGAGGAISRPMAVREPLASALQQGAGKYVTVGIRGSSGRAAHTMVKVGDSYFESGGGHGPARTKGWNGSFEKFHPAGLRRGGRVRMRRGGRIGSLLNTIAGGSQSAIHSALRQAQTLMADRGNFGSIRAWINAANRRARARGITPVGRRGLTAFIALAQAEYGRQVGQQVAAIDEAEGGFDQANTDLGNQLVIGGATDVQSATAQAQQGYQQLSVMLNDQRSLEGLLSRARRTGDRKLIKTLTQRVSEGRSGILAKQAEITGYQSTITGGQPTQEDILNAQLAQAALTPDGGDDAAARAAMLDYRQGRYLQALQGGDPREIAQTAQDLKSALDENTQAQQDQQRAFEEHTAAMKSLADEMKRQTDLATTAVGTQSAQAWRALADIMGGELGQSTRSRGYTPGTGVRFAV